MIAANEYKIEKIAPVVGAMARPVSLTNEDMAAS